MLTKPAPILHLDWLQMQVKWVDSFTPEFHRRYSVKTLEFGTRHFKCIQEVYVAHKRVATLASHPHSGILDPKAMLLKFDNWVCYDVHFERIVHEFLKLNNLDFISMSRLDFCADFNEFDNGMHPAKFIKKYVARKCLKTGKARKVRPTFSQGASEHIFEGLKFGSNLSEVGYYLYNKTLEMKEVKWKPWIFKCWEIGGLDTSKDVWRLEFSLKSGSKLLEDHVEGEVDLFVSLDTIKAELLAKCFFALYMKYFQFVWNDGKSRKDRMRPLKLLRHNFYGLYLVNAAKMSDADRSKKIFIKKLHEVNNELRGRDFFMSVEMDKYKATVIEDAHLQTWAMNKGFNVGCDPVAPMPGEVV